MIFLKKIYLILLLWILVIFGLLMFLFGTNFGTNLIFNGLTYRIPELTFDSVSGRWGNFNVVNLSYHMPSGVAHIDSCHIAINLRYMLLKQINIEHIFLKNMFIKIDSSLISNNKTNSNQISSSNNIFLNLSSIIIKNIILDNIHIVLKYTEFRCQRIYSGIMLHNNILKISPTRMSDGFILNPFPINIFLIQPDIKMIRNIFYSKHSLLDIKPMLSSLIRHVLINLLTKYNMSMNLILPDIQGKKFHIYNNGHYDDCYTINNFQIQVIWNKEIANIKLQASLPYGDFSGVGNIVLSCGYPVSIVANYIDHNMVGYNLNYKSKSNIKNIKIIVDGSLFETICIRCDFFQAVSVIRILLKITLKDLSIPIELFITGKFIPITASRKNKYVLERLNLYLTGKLCDDYCVRIKSKVISTDQSVIYISFRAQGNSNKFLISKLKLEMLNGYCEMQGIVNWEKTMSWNKTCVFHDISIFEKYLKYPIILSGKIVTQGYLSADSWKLTVSECHVDGFIKNNKIICNGSIYMESSGQLSIPIFFVKWGSNMLEIQGSIQKNRMINIDMKLKVADCSDFLSELSSGIIYGFCRIHGCMASPMLALKIEIRSLGWKEQDIDIDHITIISNFLYKNSIKNDFYIKISQIRYKNLLLHQLCIHGQGDIKKHNLNVMIYGDEISGVIHCIGAFDTVHQIWNGCISKTSIFTPIGTWELMQDIIIIYQRLSQRIILKSHYWQNANCQLMIPNNIQKSIFEKINLICKNYHFTFSDIILIESINLYGVRISCTDIDWVINNNSFLPRGKIFLSSSQLIIKYADSQNIPFVVINSIIANIVLVQTDLFCQWNININGNQNFVKLSVTDLYDKPKILGRIQIKNVVLHSLFQSLLKSQPVIQGIFNIDINLKGNLDCPLIYGVFQLERLRSNYENLPFYINNGRLEIKFLGNQAVLNGMLDTKYDNHLYIVGEISNINSIQHICMLLNIRGHEIDIDISPTIYAKISPNLVCTITAEKIDIKGDIIVPLADIIMEEFTKNIVEISAEEVILDEKYQPILNKSSNLFMFVSSVLNIHFGDNVNFNGLGLHTKLKGNLEMIYNQNDFNLLGYVNMYSGYIEVYGQNLMIKKGQLLFSGSINQTYLDMEAIRNSTVFSYIQDSVTAGMHITGLINQLKLDFFSDSSLLSQQEIMSYLLGGYNTTFSNTNNDTNMITSLLIGVGMKRCEKLVNKIGNTLGVQDLKLSTQDFGIPSLIALSGYIAPGLQIQYGINIFDLLTTMTIRYCIHPQLYLEVKSGNHNKSLDLLYKFNFN